MFNWSAEFGILEFEEAFCCTIFVDIQYNLKINKICANVFSAGKRINLLYKSMGIKMFLLRQFSWRLHLKTCFSRVYLTLQQKCSEVLSLVEYLT